MKELNTEVWVRLVSRRIDELPERDRPSRWEPGDTLYMPDVPAKTPFTTRRAMPADRDPNSPTFSRPLCSHAPVLVSPDTAEALPGRVEAADVPRAERAMVEMHRALKYGGSTPSERHAAVEQILRREADDAATTEERAAVTRLLVQARYQENGLAAERAAALADELGFADDGV